MARNASKATKPAEKTGEPRRIKTAFLLTERTRRELAVVAGEQGCELYEVAEAALSAHLGKYLLVRTMRRDEGAAAGAGASPIAGTVRPAADPEALRSDVA